MAIWAIWTEMRVSRWPFQMAIWSHLDPSGRHLEPSGAIWTLHLETRMVPHLDIWPPL